MKGDYYEVLGIERTATRAEIKRVYRRMALLLHPDRNPDNTGAAETLFVLVTAAYETLIDPVKRATYDRLTSTRPERQTERESRPEPEPEPGA